MYKVWWLKPFNSLPPFSQLLKYNFCGVNDFRAIPGFHWIDTMTTSGFSGPSFYITYGGKKYFCPRLKESRLALDIFGFAICAMKVFILCWACQGSDGIWKYWRLAGLSVVLYCCRSERSECTCFPFYLQFWLLYFSSCDFASHVWGWILCRVKWANTHWIQQAEAHLTPSTNCVCFFLAL